MTTNELANDKPKFKGKKFSRGNTKILYLRHDGEILRVSKAGFIKKFKPSELKGLIMLQTLAIAETNDPALRTKLVGTLQKLNRMLQVKTRNKKKKRR